MRKPPPAIEWHIAENEADWARLAATQKDDTTAVTAHHLSFYKNACWALAFILGLLVTLGGWWWHNASIETQHAVADYNLLVSALLRELAHPVVITHSNMLTSIPTGAVDTKLEPAIVLVEVQGEQAVVSIVTAIKAVPLICREQRLYHHTDSGWQQAALDEKVLAALRQQQTIPVPLGVVCN